MYKQNYCSAIFAQNPLFVWKAEKEGQPENSALPGYFILQNYDAYVFAIIAASSLMEDLLTLQKIELWCDERNGIDLDVVVNNKIVQFI